MKIGWGKNSSSAGITATLTVAFITLGVVVLLISSGLQIYSSIQVQDQAIASKQQLIAQEAARTVSEFIQQKTGTLETAARLIDPATMSKDAQQQVISSLLSLQPAFRQLEVYDMQDQQTAAVSRMSQADSGHLRDNVTGDMQGKIQQGQSYISPVYIDPNNSEPLIVMVQPLINIYGDVQGKLMVDVNLKFMWDLMDQVKVGDSGYAYVVDEKGTLIAYKDTSRVLQGEKVDSIGGVRQFINNLSATSAPVLNYNGINGTSVVGTYVALGTPSWAVVTELPYDEAYQEIKRELIWAIVIVLGMAAIAGVVGVFIARWLARPLVSLMQTANRISGGEAGLQAEVAGPREVAGLAVAFNSMTTRLRDLLQIEQQQRQRLQDTVRYYTEHMQRVAEGNLTDRVVVDLPEAGENGSAGAEAADPLIQLGQHLNQMTASLHSMIQQIHEATLDLSGASTEIMAATAQQAGTASEQSAAIAQTATTVDEIKEIARQNSLRSREVADEARRTVEVSYQGRQAAQETVAGMNQIKNHVQNSAENILALSKQIEKISQIITTVNDIATQSNMLALNASIEAAQAGEQGKGFSVIAMEVRSLAKQSRQATAQVKTILTGIQKALNVSVMATEEGAKGVEYGVQLSTQAGESIERLTKAIDQSAQIAEQMVAGGHQQQTGIEQIAQAMHNINQATYQGMVGTRQTEQSAQNLDALARKLAATIAQYQV